MFDSLIFAVGDYVKYNEFLGQVISIDKYYVVVNIFTDDHRRNYLHFSHELNEYKDLIKLDLSEEELIQYRLTYV